MHTLYFFNLIHTLIIHVIEKHTKTRLMIEKLLERRKSEWKLFQAGQWWKLGQAWFYIKELS